MDSINRGLNAQTADIMAVRQELKLTVHQVALALARRAQSLSILADIAGDMRIEASALQSLSNGKTQPRN